MTTRNEKQMKKCEVLSADMSKAIELFVDIAKENETCEDIIEELRSLLSFGAITDDEYDYILQEWDNILAENNL